MIFNSLKNFTQLKERIVVGLMSGTSADGIDVSVCSFTEKQIKILSYQTYSYKDETKQKIRNAKELSVREMAELDLQIGEEFAAACLQEIGRSKLECVHLIGSHGQTVYHHSRQADAKKVSVQLGCGDTIAVKTGTPVVFDFRRKDTVLEGEGAPLTPYADFRLFSDSGNKRVILNLGGISNLTVLGKTLDDVYGFDCGPANAPIDRLVRKFTNSQKHFDEDGMFARQGKANEKLLSELFKEDEFLALPPPKSTGFETYGDTFVEKIISKYGKVDESLIATVTEFVARVIVESIRRHVKVFPDELIVAGGGAKNRYLLERISMDLKPCVLKVSDDVGVPGDARESTAFAVLAHDFVCGIPTSLPKVTGAFRSACLGKLAFPL